MEYFISKIFTYYHYRVEGKNRYQLIAFGQYFLYNRPKLVDGATPCGQYLMASLWEGGNSLRRGKRVVKTTCGLHPLSSWKLAEGN